MGAVGNLDSRTDWDATEIAVRMGQPGAAGMDSDVFVTAFRLGFIAGHCQSRISPERTAYEAYQQFMAGKS